MHGVLYKTISVLGWADLMPVMEAVNEDGNVRKITVKPGLQAQGKVQ